MKIANTTKTTRNTTITCSKCAKCFEMLSVPTRLTLYERINNSGTETVTKLAQYVGVTQPTVSYHLNMMRKAGLVMSTKKGKEVTYKVNNRCPHYDRDCIFKAVRGAL